MRNNCRLELIEKEIEEQKRQWMKAKTYKERENISYVLKGMEKALKILKGVE